MSFIIDGYNLLNAAAVDSTPRGPTPLFRARQGLLNFLANALDEPIRSRTTIVFDAANAPKNLPDTFSHASMRVVFARDHGQADELIEELIQQHTAPRSLLVVSSDHRLHRAARHRGAKAIDSDVWFRTLSRRKRHAVHSTPEKPLAASQSESETAYWVKRFSE